jgi:phosphoglycerol transferase MdoB-like AlkP superfamily enzyme
MGYISYPLYFLILVCLDFAFRKLYGYVGGTGLFDRVPVLFTLFWALLLTAIALALPRLAARIYIIVTVLLVCVLAVAHAAMYNLFGSFFTFSDLLYAGDGAKFFSASYLQVRKLLLVCAALAMIGAVAAAVLLPKLRYRPWRLLTCLGAFACGVSGIWLLGASLHTDMPAEEVMSWSVVMDTNDAARRAQLYTEFTNANVCLPMTGLYQYTFRNLITVLSSADHADRAENIASLDEYFDRREVSGENEMTGVLAGKNVIMIMVESLDTWLVTEDYTPNLYALQQESVNFTNNYTPLYLTAGTFCTEFVTMTGIIPPQTGVSTDVYTDNDFSESLPHLFENVGYTAQSFHAANGDIYNRAQIHRNLGFESYSSYVEMGMDNYMLDSQMIRAFDQMTDDAPFFSFLITYSGHGPYDASMSDISATHLAAAQAAVAASGVTGSAENLEEYTLAVAHMMETDALIGELKDALEQSGKLEDTVLIVYGDHYEKYMTDPDFLMQLKGVDNRNLLCNTPLMIYSSDLAPAVVDKYVSSVDLFPTICNLFGLEVDLTRFVGDDAFGDGGGVVYWRDYSWYDGTTYFDGSTDTPATQEEAAICAEVRGKLDASWRCLEYDYFAK